MDLDWDLINRIATYYEFSGKKLSRAFSEFLRAGTAAYYDEGNRQIGEQRLMPVFRNYLRYGIEGGSDKKEIKALFDFLIDLTKKPNTRLRSYGGSKEMKYYLLRGEGEKNIMARDYNNEWFITNLDRVIEGLRVSVDFLNSVKEDLTPDSKRADAETLIGKYEALIARVEALKDAPPETHVDVCKALRPVVSYLEEEHRNNLRRKELAPSLSGPGEQSVFNKIEPKLQAAETATTPRKGSKLPNASSVSEATITPGNWEEIRSLSQVKQYRALCLSLKEGIEETLRKKEEFLNTEHSSSDLTDRMIKEKEAEKTTLQEKVDQLVRDYENGLIGDDALEAETDVIESKLLDLKDALEELYDEKGSVTDTLGEEKAFLDTAKMLWNRIDKSFGRLLLDTTSDRRMIEHFKGIYEGLRTFGEYLNDFDNNGQGLDLNALYETMQRITSQLEDKLRAANTANRAIREVEKEKRQAEKAEREKERERREQERRQRAEEKQKKAQAESEDPQKNKGASVLERLKRLSGNRTSATEAFRPDSVPADNNPSLKPLDVDDPSEAENPTNNPFGIRRRNNNGEDNN